MKKLNYLIIICLLLCSCGRQQPIVYKEGNVFVVKSVKSYKKEYYIYKSYLSAEGWQGMFVDWWNPLIVIHRDVAVYMVGDTIKADFLVPKRGNKK